MKVIGGFTDDPFIIWPWYTGRDKGPLHDEDGKPLMFFNAGHAWWHIFFNVQPDDVRAKDNYQVLRLSEKRLNELIP